MPTSIDPDLGLDLPPARRPAETAIRDALSALELRAASPLSDAEALPEVPTPASGHSLGLISIVLVAVALTVVAGVVGAPAVSCVPIVYAFDKSPPVPARAAFVSAVDEIRRHTGLTFEEGHPDAAKLHVRWSQEGVTHGQPSPVLSHRSGTRRIGYGRATWRSVSGRHVLIEGIVEVDAGVSWSSGVDERSPLAALFIHELGHVVGLLHSPDPTSFMRPLVTDSKQPGWTDQDLALLAEAGRRAGCQLPATDRRGPQPRA